MAEPKDRKRGEAAGNGLSDDPAVDAEMSESEGANLAAAAAAAELGRLEEEVARLTDRHLRLAADFDNYRKRIERERAEIYVRAQAELTARLLDAVDDLGRVAHHAESADAATLLDGVQLVEKKLLQVLESSGLEPLDPAGQIFDPATMEALATVAVDKREEDDRVADVFQRGYRFKGQLIRPARVRVKQYEA
jgi:molecular chaperone GrpE